MNIVIVGAGFAKGVNPQGNAVKIQVVYRTPVKKAYSFCHSYRMRPLSFLLRRSFASNRSVRVTVQVRGSVLRILGWVLCGNGEPLLMLPTLFPDAISGKQKKYLSCLTY